jgi:predicted PurR-regulated permease PerM
MKAALDKSPFYQKLAFNLTILSLLTAMVYLGQDILMPFLFAVLLATLISPVTDFLQRKKLNKPISIIITLVLSLSIIVAIIYFLSTQIINFLDDSDAIKTRLEEVYDSLQEWVKKNFNITIRKQDKYVHDTAQKLEAGKIVGKTFVSLTSVITYLAFLPIYSFLLLYYKDLIKRFLVACFRNGDEDTVKEVLHESRAVSQYYILGLLIEMVIVFALNTTGFLILGIKYAVFLALISALLNLVPYIGMLTANVFCMLITLVSSDNTSDVLWVGVILAVVQLVDNNFLMPLIVGSRVRINALVTLLGVLIGGTLCGVPGMFLSIPTMAVLKVIFDRVEGLEPFGMMLGDDSEKTKKKGP